jgi:amylosucrase
MKLHEIIAAACTAEKINIQAADKDFYYKFIMQAERLQQLYNTLYATHPAANQVFTQLITTTCQAYKARSTALHQRDAQKASQTNWITSNNLAGMSLYVDRFCGTLKNLPNKLDYLQQLGVNLLHIMPIMESPEGESDGGYAVSNFRKVDTRFGTIEDFVALQKKLQQRNMYVMLDIVLNHTSYQHSWAQKALAGDAFYQDFYYLFSDKNLVDAYNKNMPEIFPESSPGSFTYNQSLGKWVMTVFHNYQWDLNFTNPHVLNAMLDNILYYANLGVDVLRIDAPAFIWKQLGTNCQNLPQAHTILQIIKCCVNIATPGMALLGEAIVAPQEIIKYFGNNTTYPNECDIAYGATNMALQWDALATGDVRIMLQAQKQILQKPLGTTWISYTRCHDDIGLGYTDEDIAAAGFNPYAHRTYIKEYYSGTHSYSKASGALFSVNPNTGDARISGSLAALCSLENAINTKNQTNITTAINRIVLMQAQSITLPGIPMLFYGDEVANTNDYSYLNDTGKSYDNRWMHRPVIDWKKNENYKKANTIEATVFTATQKLLAIRKAHQTFADINNIQWLYPHNNHIAGFVRTQAQNKIVCVFNYSNQTAHLTWYAFKEAGVNTPLTCLYHNTTFALGHDHEYLELPPYGFYILQAT